MVILDWTSPLTKQPQFSAQQNTVYQLFVCSPMKRYVININRINVFHSRVGGTFF